MKPHPRIRKTIKWGGAAVTVLLVGVWIGSGWWAICIGTSHVHNVEFNAGRVTYSYFPANQGNGFPLVMYMPQKFGLLWWIFDFQVTAIASWVVVPMWTLCAPLAVGTAVAFLWDSPQRRAATGSCRACKYDRTGLARDAKCPECGQVPA